MTIGPLEVMFKKLGNRNYIFVVNWWVDTVAQKVHGFQVEVAWD